MASASHEFSARALQAHIRGFIEGVHYVAAETNGDGACGLHAVFGMPFIGQCQQEASELLATASPTAAKKDGAPAAQRKLSEPMRSCLFGIPGAGKSIGVKLLRSFFQDCLQWEDGVQFQFLASQNTMAALIGGRTIHNWGVIPVSVTQASSNTTTKSSDGDIDELFLKAAGMRWIIIDEVSTASPGLFGYTGCFSAQRHR